MFDLLVQESTEVNPVAATGGTQDDKPEAPGNSQAALDRKMENFKIYELMDSKDGAKNQIGKISGHISDKDEQDDI